MIVRQAPSAVRSPTWNFTEFVPTSMTAKRCASKPASVLSSRGTLTFGRPSSPSSRTVATTRAGSSDSTAIVRAAPWSVRSSESSTIAPPTV